MSQTLSTSDLVRHLVQRKTRGIPLRELQELYYQSDFIEAAYKFLATGQEEEKIIILVALEGIRNPEAWSIAQVALRDSSPKVRRLAARLLIDPKATSAWNALVEAIEDSDSQVRHQVARALVRIDQAAAEDLLRPLFTSPDEADRLTILDIVQKCDYQDLTQATIDALRDVSPQVRSKAAQALSNAGQDAIAALLTALDDQTEQVRCSILETLCKRAAEVPLITFIKACADSSSNVRRLALQGLAKKGDAYACSTILHFLDDPDLKRLALTTLGDLGCTQALDRLLEETQRPMDEGDRASLLKTLGKIGGNEIKPILRSALLDSAPLVRAEAVAAYSAVNPQEAVPVLLNSFSKDTSKMVRATAAEVLGNIGGHEVYSSLTKALRQEREPQVRRAAARALSNARNLQTIEALLVGLTDEDAGVRLEVVRSLGKIGLNQGIPALLELESKETSHAILAEVAAALVRIDATRFANKVLSGSAIGLFDPAGIGTAFAIWLFDPSWHPVSERVIFYNTGYAKTVDLDENCQEYRYIAEGGQLRMYDTVDERERLIEFTIEKAVWKNPLLGSQPCYRLTLNDDLFFNTIGESESVFFYNF